MIAQAQPPRNPPTPGEPPLRLRGRADLAVRRQVYQGCTSWVIKDPLSLRYFRLREEEYAVLAWLDGRRSLADIKRAYDARFSPRRIEAGDLWQYIVSLHQSGLVIADAPGQGEQLRKRRDERSRKERWSKLANLLAIRFRGIDPTRLLNLLYPAVRWMFSPVAVAGCLLLALSALLLVLVEFQVFQSRLPAFQQFFSLGNSLWLLAAMAFAKVLHEFGHGLTCRHYRGECHELGVMLLVFTPCLYCNVSDSWLLPNKWQRIAIAAAGMYVEVVLAAICTFLWWFSQEGLFNHLCLNLMLVCSVSTIVFNANPLLRFDGYYILADLVEIPNLRSKASRVLTRGLGRWCLGIESPHDPLLPTQRPGFFVFYSLAAVAYRWIITFSILYFLMNVFEPYGLQPLGHLLIACSLVGLVGVPLWRLGQYFQTPGRLEQVKRANLLTTLALLGGIAAVVAGVPFPHRVNCDFALEPHEAEPVYVQTAGQLQQVFVQPGQSVSAGQPLASLVNLDLAQQILTKEAELALQQSLWENMLRQRFDRPEDIAQESELRESIATLQSQLKTKREEFLALQRVAPRDGMVLLPPAVVADAQLPGQLRTWTGYPFDAQNRHAYFESGVLLCHVGPGEQWQAVLQIDPGDVEFIAPGQTVQLLFDQQPGQAWQGTIETVARRELAQRPRQATASPDEPSPMVRAYLAVVVLDDPQRQLRSGLKGRAKIETAPQTLLARAVRWLRQTF